MMNTQSVIEGGAEERVQGLPSSSTVVAHHPTEAISTPPPRSNGERGLLPHMDQLDALRAFAVFGVFLTHFLPPAKNVFPFGGAGVRLFFVLSGFLITGILLKCRRLVDGDEGRSEMLRPSRGFTLRQFYWRRALRIFPPFYLLLLVAFTFDVKPVRESIGWHVTYLSNFYLARMGEFQGPITHFWTLAVEEQFYLMWPFLILFTPRRSLIWMVGLTILVGPAYRAIAWAGGWDRLAAAWLTPACLDTLGLGALLALCRDASFGLGRHAAPRLAAVGLWVGAPLVIALAASRMLKLSWIVESTLTNVGVGLLSVWIIAKASAGVGGPMGAVLSWRPLRYLGRISYGLYIYHLFLPLMIDPILVHLGLWRADGSSGPAYALARFFVLVAATVMVSALSWHLFESPINALKRHFPYAGRAGSRAPAQDHRRSTILEH